MYIFIPVAKQDEKEQEKSRQGGYSIYDKIKMR